MKPYEDDTSFDNLFRKGRHLQLTDDDQKKCLENIVEGIQKKQTRKNKRVFLSPQIVLVTIVITTLIYVVYPSINEYATQLFSSGGFGPASHIGNENDEEANESQTVEQDSSDIQDYIHKVSEDRMNTFADAFDLEFEAYSKLIFEEEENLDQSFFRLKSILEGWSNIGDYALVTFMNKEKDHGYLLSAKDNGDLILYEIKKDMEWVFLKKYSIFANGEQAKRDIVLNKQKIEDYWQSAQFAYPFGDGFGAGYGRTDQHLSVNDIEVTYKHNDGILTIKGLDDELIFEAPEPYGNLVNVALSKSYQYVAIELSFQEERSIVYIVHINSGYVDTLSYEKNKGAISWAPTEDVLLVSFEDIDKTIIGNYYPETGIVEEITKIEENDRVIFTRWHEDGNSFDYAVEPSIEATNSHTFHMYRYHFKDDEKERVLELTPEELLYLSWYGHRELIQSIVHRSRISEY